MRKIIIIIVTIVSVLRSDAQQLTGYEYFFDTDPGVGAATFVAITPGVNYAGNFNVSTSTLSDGFHTFCIRFKDSSNRWSTVQARQFIKLPGNGKTDSIAAVEVFFDTDPGVGNGTITNVTPVQDYNGTITVVPPPGLTGKHLLYVRVKNTAGLWSQYQVDTTDFSLSVDEIQLLQRNGIIAFPNPTNNNVHLDFDNDYRGVVFVKVIDVTGKLMQQYSFTKQSIRTSYTMSMATYPSGNYFLILTDEHSNPLGTAKIILQK